MGAIWKQAALREECVLGYLGSGSAWLWDGRGADVKSSAGTSGEAHVQCSEFRGSLAPAASR